MPPPPDRQVPAELRSWLRRLQETVGDLAQRVADQEMRLDTLTRLLEAAGEIPPGAPAHRLAQPLLPAPASRWRRLAGRLLRAPGDLMQRFREASASRWILPLANEAQATPSLRLGEEVRAIELTGRLADLPAGYLELALRALAAEDLFFIELYGRSEASGTDLDLWLCRREWPWRLPADLGHRPLEMPGHTPLLGRRVSLDGDPRQARQPASLAGLEMRADYWLRPGAPAGIQLAARLGRGQPVPPRQPGKVAIVASRPLDSGLEVLVAELIRFLRAAGRELVLAATWDLRASHRSLAEVAPRELKLYPLATFFAPELRGPVLARLLEEEAIGTLVHLGPGEGFFDQPALQELLRQLRVIDLPLPLWPGSPLGLGRPPGVVHQTLKLDPAEAGILLPPTGCAGVPPATRRGQAAQEAARQRLGVPQDSFLACQMADLVPGERPEDLIELAARCPQIFFLQVGNGGLAGRRDDLRRFRGVANLRCLPVADLGEVLAAADVMLALGEPSLWPWPIFAALAAGVQVAGRPLGALAPFAGSLHAAGTTAELAQMLDDLRAGAAPAAPQPAPATAPSLATVLADVFETGET